MPEESAHRDPRDPRREQHEQRNDQRRPHATTHEVYVISVAAELTGMHAQTLRTYDRIGLVSPARTRGGGRRYSREDIEQLQEIQRLSSEEGVNLAGIKAIIEQRNRVRELERENELLRQRIAEMQQEMSRLMTAVNNASSSARSRGEIVHVPRSTAVVMWKPRNQRGRD